MNPILLLLNGLSTSTWPPQLSAQRHRSHYLSQQWSSPEQKVFVCVIDLNLKVRKSIVHLPCLGGAVRQSFRWKCVAWQQSLLHFYSCKCTFYDWANTRCSYDWGHLYLMHSAWILITMWDVDKSRVTVKTYFFMSSWWTQLQCYYYSALLVNG